MWLWDSYSRHPLPSLHLQRFTSKASITDQGWQGRWGVLTSAQRPAPPDKISAQRPRAPPVSRRTLARASRPPHRPPGLYCPGLIQGPGWQARESRSLRAPRLRACARHAGTQCGARRRAAGLPAMLRSPPTLSPTQLLGWLPAVRYSPHRRLAWQLTAASCCTSEYWIHQIQQLLYIYLP